MTPLALMTRQLRETADTLETLAKQSFGGWSSGHYPPLMAEATKIRELLGVLDLL